MARQRLFRTRAVVIKRMDLGEADRILTLYTRDYGKLRAVAKGVRRTTSRSAGHLELFTLSDVLLARGRELDVVSQAEIVTPFRRVREDLDRTSHAYYLAELADHLTEDRHENVPVFEALVEGFEALEDGLEPRLVVVWFQVHLLHVLGYRPELTHCVVCRTEIQPGANQFSLALGGVVCPDCGPREPSARPLADAPLKLLRNLQRTAGVPRVNAPEAVLRAAEQLLRTYAEGIMERRLVSPQLIARVGRGGPGEGL